MKTLYAFYTAVLLFASCLGFGQGQAKKQLTEDDYHLWGSLNVGQLSNDGEYVSYSMSYESGNDTLFVAGGIRDKRYTIPGGHSGVFGGNKWFACHTRGGYLQLINLSTGSIEKLNAISDFSFSPDANTMLLRTTDDRLILRQVAGSEIVAIQDVTEYKYSQDGRYIAYCAGSGANYSLGIIPLMKGSPQTLVQDTVAFEKIVWQKSGSAFAVLQSGPSGKVRFYIVSDRLIFTKLLEPDMEIVHGHAAALTISDDGQRVFFGTRKKLQRNDYRDKGKIQIWNTADQWFYPAKIAAGGPDHKARLAIWSPSDDQFLMISDKSLPNAMLAGNQSVAILNNPNAYEPQASLAGNTDYYLTDVISGKQKLLILNSSGNPEDIEASPLGNFIVYRQGENWLIYDILKDTNRNLTVNLSTAKSRDEHKSSPKFEAVAGWTADQTAILLYDEYDLWKFSIATGNATRLTKGREKGMAFRHVPSSGQMRDRYNFDGYYGVIIDLEKPVILSARGSLGEWLYCIWTPKRGTISLMNGAKRLTSLIATPDGKSYAYLSEDFEHPPALYIQSFGNKPVEVFKSNTHHHEYEWGRSEHFSYMADGQKMSAGLLYPAGYNPEKKYPMIVLVYEKLSPHRFIYSNPSLYNLTGFNAANLTAKGYFLLYPDVEYKTGNPGVSAFQCVLAAVDETVKRGLIEEDKIGLVGHSFGGFETAYIISQTNRFATAVAGSAITDLTSLALSSTVNFNKPEFWRLEQDQFRMKKSLFEDMNAYLSNSPVLHAANVQTPLLSWTGENDGQINKQQTMEFWFALWRLRKENTMIIYPGEGHALMNPDSQADLTKRIESWLDHYLKGKPPASWMLPDYEP